MSRGYKRERSPGRWELFAPGGTDDAGRRIRITRRFHGNERAADRELAKLVHETDRGVAARSGAETFGGYLTKTWLPFMHGRVKANTWTRYEGVVRLHVVPRIGGVRLSGLRPHHLQRVLDETFAAGVAPRTVAKVHLVVRSALEQAVRWQLLSTNPAAGVRGPRAARPELRIPDASEMRALVDQARGTPWEIPIMLAATTGARRSEICNATGREVDLDAPTWTITSGKTSSARRTIYLPRSTVAALRRHRRAQAERRLLLGPAWQEHDAVCDRGDGMPIDPQAFTFGFRRIASEAGLAGIRLHDLRHGFATELLRRGVPVKVVSEALGHARASITMDVYQHVLPTMGEQVADAIEDALGP
jgi:integrase